MRADFLKWAKDEAAEEKRKQELHEQRMQFNAEKHMTALDAAQKKILSEQQNSMPPAPPPPPPPDPMELERLRTVDNSQQQVYRQNLLNASAPKTAAEEYGYDPGWASAPNPVWPTAAGAALGGVAAHALLPTEDTKRYREALKRIPEEAVTSAEETYAKGGKVPIKKMIGIAEKTSKGNKSTFALPAHLAKKYLQEGAWKANAGRMVAGLGAGAGVGYLAHRLLNED